MREDGDLTYDIGVILHGIKRIASIQEGTMAMQEKQKLTLRLNKRLIEQAKQYAAEHNLSVSELVETFFLHLESVEEPEHTPLVRRLTGLLPPDVDVQEAYRRHLVEKYGG